MLIKLKQLIKSTLRQIEALIVCMLPTWTSMSYKGYKLFYNRGNTLIKRFKREKGFEEELIHQMTDDLNKINNPVLLDIGSNIGLISVALISNNQKICIHAFEPGPVQREAFQKTINGNNITNVTLYPYALSNTEGDVDFFTHINGDQAKDGIRDTKRGASTFVVPVEMKTLDSWWNSIGKIKIDAIKIDTEGAELLVLQGAKQLLDTCHPILYFEVEPRNFIPYGYTSDDVFTYIKSFGYSLEKLHGSEDTFIAK